MRSKLLCQGRFDQGDPARHPLNFVSRGQHPTVRALDKLTSSLAAFAPSSRASFLRHYLTVLQAWGCIEYIMSSHKPVQIGGEGHPAGRMAVFGNLTLDELDKDGKHSVRPGGTALYTSLAAAQFGIPASIFSNIGEDYPRGLLERIHRNGVNVSGVRRFAGKTTRFQISYPSGLRRLELVSPSRKLKLVDAIASFRTIHLGPVFSEVGLDALEIGRSHSKFLSIDLQGLLRETDQKGRVKLVKRDVRPFLEECNLVKVTEEEARVMIPAKSLLSKARQLLREKTDYVLITRGRLGCLLVPKVGRAFRIPPFPETRIEDPTGAGDIFVGSWLATFQIAGDALWAGAVGAALSSLAMRRLGLSKFRFSRRELFRRAGLVYRDSRPVNS